MVESSALGCYSQADRSTNQRTVPTGMYLQYDCTDFTMRIVDSALFYLLASFFCAKLHIRDHDKIKKASSWCHQHRPRRCTAHCPHFLLSSGRIIFVDDIRDLMAFRIFHVLHMIIDYSHSMHQPFVNTEQTHMSMHKYAYANQSSSHRYYTYFPFSYFSLFNLLQVW